jgi:hypothetical protein
MDSHNALIEVVYCHIVIKCPLVLDPLSLIQIPFLSSWLRFGMRPQSVTMPEINDAGVTSKAGFLGK